MGLATIDQLFSSPWGIVEFRRLEIEVGPYGAYERVLEEEVGRNFVSATRVATLFDCHESTARKWLRRYDARFIIRGSSYLYFKPDVEKAKVHRTEQKAARKMAA
jgi:hypothetical protein